MFRTYVFLLLLCLVNDIFKSLENYHISFILFYMSINLTTLELVKRGIFKQRMNL